MKMKEFFDICGHTLIRYQGDNRLVVIPETIRFIAKEAFLRNAKVCEVVLPAHLVSIGNSAFEGCKNLRYIQIPDTILNVGERAFFGCEKLPIVYHSHSYYIGNEENPYVVLLESEGAAETCTVHSGTVAIAASAFNGNTKLKELSLPKSVRGISESTFCGCSSLNRLTIQSDHLLHIGKWAFSGCPSKIYHCYRGAYYLGNEKNPFLALISCLDANCHRAKVHPDTRVIAPSSFWGCQWIRSLRIPSRVEAIGEEAFAHFKRLHIKVPTNIIVEKDAFYGCLQVQ